MSKNQLIEFETVIYFDTRTNKPIALDKYETYTCQGKGRDTLRLYKRPEWLSLKLDIISQELQVSKSVAEQMLKAPQYTYSNGVYHENPKSLMFISKELFDRIKSLTFDTQNVIIKKRITLIEKGVS